MEDEGGEDTDKMGDDVKEEVELGPGTYWLTRVVFLRYLGFIYLVAFLISFHQNKELIGSRGLTPASNYLLNSESSDSHQVITLCITILPPVGASLPDAYSRFVHAPTLLWLAHPLYTDLDTLLDGMALTGALVAAAVRKLTINNSCNKSWQRTFAMFSQCPERAPPC